jgi:hypothetical protein
MSKAWLQLLIFNFKNAKAAVPGGLNADTVPLEMRLSWSQLLTAREYSRL